jgi:hypothetical protein
MNRSIGSGTRSVGTSTSGNNPISGIIGLAFTALSIWGLVCAARIIFATVSLLLKGLGGGLAATITVNIALSAVAGFFAAVGTEILRQNYRRASKYGGHFISSLFQKRLGESMLDSVFWGRVVIGGCVGLAAGAVNGSMGILNFPQFLWGTAGRIIHESSYPIIAFVGGGFGGPGGTGFFSLAFLVLVIIISAVLAAFLIGFLLHLLMYGIAGMTKGATKAYLTDILRDQSAGEGKDDHPVVAGMRRGFYIGLIVGIIESVFTVLGIIKFY